MDKDKKLVEASWWEGLSSVQFSSVTQSCLTLCDPMNRSTPGLPVHHQLPEFTQIHVRWVGDAIQPSHPLLSTSPPAPNPSQHQSFLMSQLFIWGGQSTAVSTLASFLPKKSQGWSPSEWTGWISLQSKGLSRVFSNTTVQKHQFFGRNDAKAETPVLWPPHAKSWLIGKDSDAGRDWGQEKGTTGWDGWMASPTRWTWVWVNSGSWWWTGRPGVLQFMGSQRVGHDWATELNWTDTLWN